MQRKNELMEMASDMGISVVNAKNPEDGNKTAIHILNPDMDALENAIHDADHKCFNTIVIHSKQTWPYRHTIEKVEADNDKLLA